MKRIFLIILMAGLLALASYSYAADGILKDFPNVKQGVAYSLADQPGANILSLTTVDVVKWNDLSVGAGMVTELDNDENINPAVTLNYNIGGLEKWGCTYPLAKFVNIDVGLFASRDIDGEDTNYGLTCSILRIKL